MKSKVELKKVKKSLKKLPTHIVHKFQGWVDNVESSGIAETRKVKGYHDEPLKGNRKGQRSIRLNDAYRAIYTEAIDGTVNVITVEEVSKHDY